MAKEVKNADHQNDDDDGDDDDDDGDGDDDDEFNDEYPKDQLIPAPYYSLWPELRLQFKWSIQDINDFKLGSITWILLEV